MVRNWNSQTCNEKNILGEKSTKCGMSGVVRESDEIGALVAQNHFCSDFSLLTREKRVCLRVLGEQFLDIHPIFPQTTRSADHVSTSPQSASNRSPG